MLGGSYAARAVALRELRRVRCGGVLVKKRATPLGVARVLLEDAVVGERDVALVSDHDVIEE